MTKSNREASGTRKKIKISDAAIWLSEKEVSKIIGIAVQTLRNDRCQGRGFSYYKSGRMIRYKRSEIMDAMDQCRVTPRNTRQEAAAQ